MSAGWRTYQTRITYLAALQRYPQAGGAVLTTSADERPAHVTPSAVGNLEPLSSSRLIQGSIGAVT